MYLYFIPFFFFFWGRTLPLAPDASDVSRFAHFFFPLNRLKGISASLARRGVGSLRTGGSVAAGGSGVVHGAGNVAAAARAAAAPSGGGTYRTRISDIAN